MGTVFPVPDYGKTVRVRKSCFGKCDSRGGTVIPVVLNIQFWIPDCDMNIIREAGSCWLYLSEYGPCSVPADEDILSASIPVNALRSCHGTKKICYERTMTVCTGMNHGALSGLFSRIPFVPEAVAYEQG